MAAYFGASSGINQVTSKEIKNQKEADKQARQDARDKVKQDNAAIKDGTYGVKKPSLEKSGVGSTTGNDSSTNVGDPTGSVQYR